MTDERDMEAPLKARAGNAAEDRRRDEVLCRLLNTPYQPINPLRGDKPMDTAASDLAATA